MSFDATAVAPMNAMGWVLVSPIESKEFSLWQKQL